MHFKRLLKAILSSALSVLTVFIFIQGCTSKKDLSRSSAKKILEKKINEPMYTKLPSGFVVASHMPGSFESFSGMGIKSPTPAVYKELQSRGLITLTNLGMVMLGERYYVAFTPDAEKEFVKERKKGEVVTLDNQSYTKDESTVLLANSKVGDITGITEPSMVEGRKVAFVDFNVHIEKTPFGEVMLPDFLKKTPVPFRAEFVLYDDGWRVSDKVLPVEFWKLAK